MLIPYLSFCLSVYPFFFFCLERPLLLGTGPILGLGPAPSFTFIIYCSPVGAYFKGGQLTPIKLKVEEQFHRAAPGGTGNTKCAGNYSPVLKVQLEAKKNGFADVLYLDAVHNTYVEEGNRERTTEKEAERRKSVLKRKNF